MTTDTEKQYAPHQQRVIEEQSWVKEKYDELMAAINNATFLLLPMGERELLMSQSRIMRGYLRILDKRIALFAPDE